MNDTDVFARSGQRRALPVVLAFATLLIAACGASTSAKQSSSAATHGTGGSPSAAPSAANQAGLTSSGSTLPAGQAATVHFQAGPTDAIGTLRISITVRPGSIQDLKAFQLDAQSKLGVPFYISATVKNTGAANVNPAGFFGSLTPRDAAGDEITSITLLGDFAKCQGTAPSHLRSAAQFSMCEVYIAPKGHAVTKVDFDGYAGKDEKETKVTWRTAAS